MSTVGDPLHRSAIRHYVVDGLLLEVFRRDLPAGSRLIVQQLTSKFGVSSTPVREALVELESIGIVEFVHNRGVMVRPFGPRQLREIYQLRKILEIEAARGASGHIDLHELSELDDQFAELQKCPISQKEQKDWSEREMASDRHLHELVATHCGNSRLSEELRRYNRLMQVIRDIVGNQRQAQELAIDEHRKIVRALADDNVEQAAAAMAEHIDRTAKSAEHVFFGDEQA
ncbi:GntR family transcriptional regulator [Aeoliella mucimassa]|nr:GntR family transcriptional regulator [Aeoliella mucimassa]